jgi:hypothetical protein
MENYKVKMANRLPSFHTDLAELVNLGIPHRVQNGSGAHTAFTQWVGTRGSFRGVKRLGREADHSPPSNAEVKNVWSYMYTPPIHLCGMVLY